ncbi:putative wall-associated receptor kinase-like 16 isoform X2 [Cornus florida]|uniref:putative wall-associated receptor kinase-like 16 isoform X2 n=1 Tax=Cornus florida TaxID=4283 RepID=UPI0028973F1E|nr:putative wall-associated receptor kinase-like 16 isoform X2 [Cornus florida]
MGLQRKHLQMVLLWCLVAVLALATTKASQTIRSDCDEYCGDVSIPYPFGTSEGCYFNKDFLITCDHSVNPPKAQLLNSSTVEVLNISIDAHELRIHTFIAIRCYDSLGHTTDDNISYTTLPFFPFSYTRNKFTAVGCDTFANAIAFQGDDLIMAGCLSFCTDENSTRDGVCSGIGCCQSLIPEGLLVFNSSVGSLFNHSRIWDFSPCSYSFLVEEDAYNFSTAHLKDLQYRRVVPTVLDWAVGNLTCEEAQKNSSNYACPKESVCNESSNGPGYRCNCPQGYRGNPYLPFPNGCQGISIGFAVLLIGGNWLYWGFKQRKLVMLKEKFFRQNGGFLLQQQLHERQISANAIRIFTTKELEDATNNYDESRIVGQGGFGTVYKGIFKDNRTVAIKKSKMVDRTQIDQFINEVVVLSQINHRNVVKLLGCCLETEVPLLVYEFITNDTLYHHIHSNEKTSVMSLEIRLRIAAEIAGVLSYLHCATSVPIIHRDVKSMNILLDDNFTTKVSDFGASRLIALDETQVSTMVLGTVGYLDPEYLQTNQLTEKSDVYSFGVLLVELLTGKKPLSHTGPEKERSLAMYFLALLKEDRLFQILDDCVVQEGNPEQLREVANVAKRCLMLKGEERPTMREVAAELEGLRKMERHGWVGAGVNSEEREYLLRESEDHGYGGGGNTTAGYDSIKDQVLISVGGPR